MYTYACTHVYTHVYTYTQNFHLWEFRLLNVSACLSLAKRAVRWDFFFHSRTYDEALLSLPKVRILGILDLLFVYHCCCQKRSIRKAKTKTLPSSPLPSYTMPGELPSATSFWLWV